MLREKVQKAQIFIGSFWHAWIRVYGIKRFKGNIPEYLEVIRDQAGSKKEGLRSEDIIGTVEKASKGFKFHKDQICLSKSLAEYYYLTLYGFEACLIMEMDFHKSSDFNCHCWVVLKDKVEASGYEFDSYNRLNDDKIFVLLEKINDQQGG